MPAYDTHELAWAAGFFDGEGTAVLANKNSTRVHPTTGKRRDYPTPTLAVTQHYSPETVERFHAAVLGLGLVSGPHTSKGTGWAPRWMWQCRRPHEVIPVVALLWTYLCSTKQDQISEVMSAYLVDAATRRSYSIAGR